MIKPILLLLILISVNVYSSKITEKEKNIYDALTVYAKILNHIENSYYKDTKPEDLIYKSIKEMVKSLDPHSEYMTEAEYKVFNGDLSGEKFGIGVEYKIQDDDVIITRVYKGSPADKVGLKKDMNIEKINDTQVYEKSKSEIDDLINGKIGTSLNLTYYYKNRFKTVTLIRDKIELDVIENFLVNEKIIYVKISSFQKNISKKFFALAIKNKTKSFIIDLRDNPGGYVDEAVSLANFFIEKGVIVSSKERNKGETFYYADNKTPFKDLKILILINSETASAAEIFVAAMKEYKKAIIIGERSYGKGSIQSIIKIQNNGALKLTVALYFTPKHDVIQAKGITPHIEIPKYFTIEKKEREEDIKNIIKLSVEGKNDIFFPEYLKEDKQFQTAVNFLNN
jgi:carboxyl-terminal processing protease